MWTKIKQSSKNYLRKYLLSKGYAIYNLIDYRARMDTAIQSLSTRNHSFNTIIDVGASDGRWSSMVMKTYPTSNYLLIEANPNHESEVIKFCKLHNNAQYILAAAGDTVGNIEFDASSDFIGQASHSPAGINNITVPMTTIDHEVKSRKLTGPFLIKLDTHGFEVPILNGAEKVLTSTEALILECYNFKISSECLLFYEMCEHVGKLGFRCVDLVDPRHRPFDKALWQFDLVFLNATCQEFRYHEYY